MKWGWPWRRKPKCQTNSERAATDALTNLDSARARWPEVRKVSEDLRRTREQNGFGESMMQLFRETR